jgi:hypothetical protein
MERPQCPGRIGTSLGGGDAVLVILFSKDRPLQLHATLKTLERHCLDSELASVVVLYYSSSPEFSRAYQELRQHPFHFASLVWKEEQVFRDDLLHQLFAAGMAFTRPMGLMRRLLSASDRFRGQHFLFLVDDALFVRPFSLGQMVAALAARPKALGFSLRLGRNTTRCYSRNRQQRLPVFGRFAANSLVFRWLGEEGDFGYPLEISSSLYRATDLIKLLMLLPYRNPNRLEQALAICSKLFAWRRPELLCFDQSVAFCAPVNKVQSVIDNRASDTPEYASERLNALFLEGVRIDASRLDGFLPQAAHQEIELPLLLPSVEP